MVAQTNKRASRRDDIGKTKSNTKRYGIFKHESQNSQYFESGRDRSVKGGKESTGERGNQRSFSRYSSLRRTNIAPARNLLNRGKIGPSPDFLKTETDYESIMFHKSDCEFFQDLGLWCSTDKEDQALTIDKKITEERAYNTTPNTQFSPRGWDGFDANSPLPQNDFYSNTPKNPLSPSLDDFMRTENKFPYPDLGDDRKISEKFLDISSLPVVIGDMASENISNIDQLFSANQQQSWAHLQEENTHMHTHSSRMPFIDQEDSLGGDTKCITWSGDILTNEAANNDIVISEYIINPNSPYEVEIVPSPEENKQPHSLMLELSSNESTYLNDIITTPDVLSYVEQLEKEKFGPITELDMKPTKDLVDETTDLTSADTSSFPVNTSSIDYEPITPKTEPHIESDCEDIKSSSSKRKRHDSEDSDETYTPYVEKSTTRKYKRRKPSVPIKDMILALEGTQQQNKARRGRPPKRRDSVVSSVCSVDDNTSSMSTQEVKYRELRDKNNEASKRSRMNRKLKELQMEQLATELEERNKKLKVRADILEDMTKRLKDSLMKAILLK